MRQGALISTRYTTVNILRTMEAVLGLKPMNLNDGLAMPMTDVFDPAQSKWSYRAEAADVLRATQLPISRDRFVATPTASACPTRSAAYWAAAMKGQNFASEDRLDAPAFNSALWKGLGSGSEPKVRDGTDLRNGQVRTGNMSPAPCATRVAEGTPAGH